MDKVNPKRKSYVNVLYKVTDKELKQYVSESTLWFDVLTKCGYPIKHSISFYGNAIEEHGASAKNTVVKRCTRANISYEHLKRKHSTKAGQPLLSLVDHACKRGHTIKRRDARVLHKRLQDSGRLYICEWCRCDGMTLEHGEWLWRDWPLQLQIDHIHGLDGTEDQDRIDNLRYLCPSCHSQTATFCRGTHTQPPKKYKVNPRRAMQN